MGQVDISVELEHAANAQQYENLAHSAEDHEHWRDAFDAWSSAVEEWSAAADLAESAKQSGDSSADFRQSGYVDRSESAAHMRDEAKKKMPASPWSVALLGVGLMAGVVLLSRSSR